MKTLADVIAVGLVGLLVYNFYSRSVRSGVPSSGEPEQLSHPETPEAKGTQVATQKPSDHTIYNPPIGHLDPSLVVADRHQGNLPWVKHLRNGIIVPSVGENIVPVHPH